MLHLEHYDENELGGEPCAAGWSAGRSSERSAMPCWTVERVVIIDKMMQAASTIAAHAISGRAAQTLPLCKLSRGPGRNGRAHDRRAIMRCCSTFEMFLGK